MKIRMVGIPVHDPKKAHEHYTTVLGFKSFMFDPEQMMAIVVSAEEPEGTAIILEPAPMNELSVTFQKGLREQKIPVITLSTDDLQAEYIRLVNLDVPFLKTPTEQPWGKEAIFDDGQGNYIQVIEENEKGF